eukprot:TRINITY_DN22591_c0_g1_i1.p2 TRINITY_DN22591_c0_g1~~TRINITY_DN22591_c0_g1_i1.p2  ORF type:complete len:111 (-),score=20.15 TRINITY_DN22591_c0_g1_i1:26-358(-)
MCKDYPLHKAALLGDDRMVAYLLVEGAKVDLKDKPYGGAGRTAVEVAASMNENGSHTKVISILRDHAMPTLLTTPASPQKRSKSAVTLTPRMNITLGCVVPLEKCKTYLD